MDKKLEQETLTRMITIYCRKKHRSEELCESCSKLLAYAINRLERCPCGADKKFCSQCKTPCYGKNQREAIRRVMRFSGPRMLFYDPKMVLKHLIGK